HTAGVAVVTTLGVMDDVPGWALEGVQRVTLCAHGLGGRAALVRPDDDDLLAVAQVDVECLTGTVTEHR
ncbi:MAG: hypothetical protein JJU45_19675, partial [Acidimicrobiia bacterium]|nr:hypothetical protein [Acidimicrobiia bacterium]